MSTHGARPTRKVFEQPSRTKQEFKDQCDVNHIMARYESTGLISHLAKGHPQFLDVSEIPDYQAMLDRMIAVGDFFMGLPAKIRDHFDNDPSVMMEAIGDPERRDEMVDLGLVELTEEAPEEAPETSPPPSDSDPDPDPSEGGS